MKWVFVFLNVGAAAAVVAAGMMLCNLHRVHSNSVFTELVDRKVLAKPEDQKNSGGQLDIAKRLEAIGGLDTYIPMITFGAAGFFLLNAVAFMVCWKTGAPKPS